MKASHVDGVRLAAVASAVPSSAVSLEDDAKVFGTEEMVKISQSTGIARRHVARRGICTSDLCVAAAERLFAENPTWRKTVDATILVTQTPDYYFPASSCSVHSRLRLQQDCAAFDVNLGCSGYTYGMWMASHLISSGAASRVLLLAGDTASQSVGCKDRATRPIFGDGGTASIVEASPSASRMWFRHGTDGSGQNHILAAAGAFRLPRSPLTEVATTHDDGNDRSLNDGYMNGPEVFLFTLSCVPRLLKTTLADASWSLEDVDAIVLHQANAFMLKHVAKNMKIPADKLPLSLGEYGNTSSASIPITMTTQLPEKLASGKKRLVLAGWGVGLSWCSVALEVENVVLPPMVEVDCQALFDQLTNSESEEASHIPLSVRRVMRGTL
jgi:3-oxoacyl-[acyl-carrier-protein] synthase-3